jgi:hypothetical protein
VASAGPASVGLFVFHAERGQKEMNTRMIWRFADGMHSLVHYDGTIMKGGAHIESTVRQRQLRREREAQAARAARKDM